ncbi:MAG TPA: hypothetical protein PLV04_05400 [Phenylobacterium sp.]|jgi:hypothetical protein|uniref:Uncharacterized protein n=1 Tax=Phenylobacterium conjunctum TaxID=1298959 RepID=A0ABW3SYD5_9CAUL|nr:hypothetical protein [Phenylobacterium sp.]HQN51250.1 hypothetical protein [Phenylobacterium sp.]
MFVSLLAAGLLALAEGAAAVPPVDAVATAPAAKPEMKRVCVKKTIENSKIPKVTCMMMPVKAASAPAEDSEQGQS